MKIISIHEEFWDDSILIRFPNRTTPKENPASWMLRDVKGKVLENWRDLIKKDPKLKSKINRILKRQYEGRN